MRKHILLIPALVWTLTARADQDSSDLARSVFGTTGTQAGGISDATAAREAATAAAAKPTTAPSINPAAAQGQASQSGGSGANAAAGIALMAAGMAMMSSPPTVPAGTMLMAMGALAMMQSGADKSAADQSAATKSATDISSNDAATNPTFTDPATGAAGFKDPTAVAAMAALKDQGVTVTPAGVTAADGTFTPSSAFSSGGSMAAAGIDPAAIAEAKRISAQIDSKYGGAKVSTAVDSGGGGGGGAASERAPEDKILLKAFANPFAMNAAAKKQLIAGKTVLFDGEPIGVRGNNIFDMVHSAYDRKRAGNNFIESDNSGVPMLRAPASTPQVQPLRARGR